MNETLKRYLRYTSWPIIAAMIALMTIGVLAIGVSERADPGLSGQATRQTLFLGVALAVFVGATIVPYQRVGRLAYALFGLTLAVLVAVLLQEGTRGSRRWFDLGVIKIQPSEIAKLAYILALAWYLRQGDHYRRLRGLAVPFVLTFVPMGLILYEPDLGTALLFLPTLYVMLFMAGAKLKHLLLFLAMGAAVLLAPAPRAVDAGRFAEQRDRFIARTLGPLTYYRVDESLDWSRRPRVPVAYCRVQLAGGPVYDIQPFSLRVLMKGHQTDRIEGWLRQDDPRVALHEGFQLRWSLVTLAAGRVGGRRTEDSRYADLLPLALHQLPDDHTDFIFSVIGGRWGFVGCLVLMAMYGVIFVFGVEIATITYDAFGRLLAVGVLGLLLTQMFINIGMTMGLMPITGMTLPLISYGGSSLVVNSAALGLLVNVGMRRPILLSQRPFEHGDKREKPARFESRGATAGGAPQGPTAARDGARG